MKSLIRTTGCAITICVMLSPYIALAADITLDACTATELDNPSGHTNTECTSDTLTLTSSQTSGSYETPVLDAGSLTNWSSLSWTPSQPYGKSLVGSDESAYSSNNMNNSANAVMLLSFNEDSGTFVDLSGNGNDGTAVNATHGATGKVGQAVDFDGSDDTVVIAHDDTLDLTENITIAAWVYADSFLTDNAILEKRSSSSSYPIGYSFSVNQDRKLRFFSRDNSTSTRVDAVSSSTITSGGWRHVAVTYDRSNVRFYINGQAAGAPADTSALNSNTHDLTVGLTGNGFWDWNGRIDELGVWNTALSQADIVELYERGAQRLFIDVRTCDDDTCFDESYTTTVSEQDNATSGLPSVSLSEPNNRYAQARVRLETDSSSIQPVLQNLTLTYGTVSVPEFGPLLAAALILAGGLYATRRYSIKPKTHSFA